MGVVSVYVQSRTGSFLGHPKHTAHPSITYYCKSLTQRVTQSARRVEEALEKEASGTEILPRVYRHQRTVFDQVLDTP